MSSSQIGSWQPDTGVDHHHVSLLDNETPLWVGDYAERVKCLNPGVMVPRETKPTPVLSIITVLVRLAFDGCKMSESVTICPGLPTRYLSLQIIEQAAFATTR